MRKQYHPFMDRLMQPTFQGLSGNVKNDSGTEENKTGDVPTPQSDIGPLVDSLETFDAIVEKVVQMNDGKWISQEVTAVVRGVLKAIAEVNKSKGVSASVRAAAIRAGEVGNE